MAFKEAYEMLRILESQFIGHLPDGFVRVEKPLLGRVDHLQLDILLGRFPGLLFHQIAEIIGRQAYFACKLREMMVTLRAGAIWCLWILSGKHAGGKVRLQKYDTGRGFIPFIIILVLVLAAGPAAYLMPKNAGSLQPIVDGGYAALEAINANHGFLLFCSIGGAILSFIRKMLLV